MSAHVQILLALRGVFVLIVFRETVEVLDPVEREGFDFRFPLRGLQRFTRDALR